MSELRDLYPAAKANSFSVLLCKTCSNKVVIASWCTMMDLLVLVTNDNQLALHRLNWQKLWSFIPDAAAQSLAWSADGQSLAVFTEDGTITIHEAETGETVTKEQCLSGSACSAQWLDYKLQSKGTGVLSAVHGRLQRFCAVPRPAIPPAGLQPGLLPTKQGKAKAGSTTSRAQGSWQTNSHSTMSLVVVLDKQQDCCLPTVTVLTRDLFLLMRCPLQHEGTHVPADARHQIALSPSIRTLWLWQEATSATGCCLRVYSTGVLAQHPHQTHHMSCVLTDIMLLMQGLQESLEYVQKEWSIGRKAFDGIRNGLQDALAKNAVQHHAAHHELRQMLITGAVCNAAQSYLVQNLGEEGIKKVARQVDSAVHLVHHTVSERMSHSVEMLLFCLGELQGLANCSEWDNLGLQASVVDDALVAAGSLLLQLHTAQQLCSTAGAGYRLFCSWLLRWVRYSTDESPDKGQGFASQTPELLSFMDHTLVTDQLGELLGGGSQPLSPHTKATSSLVCELAALLLPAPLQHGSLSEQLTRVHSTTEVLCSAFSSALSPSVQLQTALQLSSNSIASSPVEILSSHLHTQQGLGVTNAKSDVATLLLTCRTSEACQQWLCILHLASPSSTGNLPLTLEGAALQLPAGFHIVAPAVYRYKGKGEESVVSILVHEPTVTAYLIQLPTTMLSYVHLSDEPEGGVLQELLRSTACTQLADCQESLRFRKIELSDHPDSLTGLALTISGPRGLAAVVSEGQVLTVLDLQDDPQEDTSDAGDDVDMEQEQQHTP